MRRTRSKGTSRATYLHILKELTQAVLRVLARLRKQLTAAVPALPRGHLKDTPEARRQRRRARALRRRVTALFEQPYLFVRHHLSAAERQALWRLTRGQAPLCALRAIMEEVYRLFDRRCCTATALAKLARLRRQVRRFRSLGKCLDKLHSPNPEKALTFLDDKLLPATSNAVERCNRRLRRLQKPVYRARKRETLRGRLALNRQREQQATGRDQTLTSLRQTRGGPD
jgi:hypothetical protein